MSDFSCVKSGFICSDGKFYDFEDSAIKHEKRIAVEKWMNKWAYHEMKFDDVAKAITNDLEYLGSIAERFKN